MAGKKAKSGKSFKKLAVAVGAAVMVAGSVPVAKRVIDPGEMVTEVIDGDSFKIKNKQTIRLASLDAPPLEYCMGAEAKEALVKMILGKKVILKYPKTDVYRRIMALVYVDGVLVNEYLIKNGFALSTREAGDETENIKAANDYARQNSLGVYGPECYQKEPPDPGCPIKGNVDDRTKAKEYLLPECRHYTKVIIERYAGEEWFCTEKEAKSAGFTLSSDCLGSER